MSNAALATQVGGNHYKKWAIQPVVFSELNNLSACQHSIVKYVMRYGDKDGMRDLQKALHFCDLLIEIHNDYLLDLNERDITHFACMDHYIPVEDFIAKNKLPVDVAAVIELVCIAPDAHSIAEAKAVLAEMLAELELSKGA
jgi:hypothetical protein